MSTVEISCALTRFKSGLVEVEFEIYSEWQKLWRIKDNIVLVSLRILMEKKKKGAFLPMKRRVLNFYILNISCTIIFPQCTMRGYSFCIIFLFSTSKTLFLKKKLESFELWFGGKKGKQDERITKKEERERQKWRDKITNIWYVVVVFVILEWNEEYENKATCILKAEFCPQWKSSRESCCTAVFTNFFIEYYSD